MFNAGRVRVLALALADVLCLTFVWLVSVCGYWGLGRALLRFGVQTSIGRYSPSDYLFLWPVVLAFVAINAAFDLYHGNWMYPSAPHSPVEEFRRIVLSSAVVHVGVIAFLAFSFQTTEGYSRAVISFSGLLVAFLAQSFRNWMRFVLAKLDVAQIPVALVGGAGVSERLAQALAGNPYLGFRIAICFDEVHADNVVAEAKKRDIKILLSCQDLRLLRHKLDEFAQWFTYIEYFPSAQAFPIFGSRAVSVDGIGGIEMVNQGRMKAKRVQKWLMDTSLVLLAFVLLSPLFILLPILIKLTSRGPVFYRQRRLGRSGKPFRVWKFRSMYADAEERLQKVLAENPATADEWRRNFKLANDPRITPFGRFLRRTSMDELPQLFNVFAGDMALVGPRPIVQEEVAFYGDSYEIFSAVKPGITGLWQVSGRSDTDYARRVALDSYYVLNWSPWMDIWVLLRTAFAVVLMRGAR